MLDQQLQTCDRLHDCRCIDLRKTFIKSWQLRVDAKAQPRQRHETDVIKKIRIRRAVERVVEIDVKKSIEFEPGDRRVIAAGLEAIANAETPDCPVGN